MNVGRLTSLTILLPGAEFLCKDQMFHEWCLDYFRYCWYGYDEFQERKLKE